MNDDEAQKKVRADDMARDRLGKASKFPLWEFLAVDRSESYIHTVS